jgi:hypothetical protein
MSGIETGMMPWEPCSWRPVPLLSPLLPSYHAHKQIITGSARGYNRPWAIVTDNGKYIALYAYSPIICYVLSYYRRYDVLLFGN